ncbi:uncharacterized protein LOC129900900 isoform X1 [Solanum dulcamara]|uniref:uncharacterized protein LOC129900900 isoform X1 n=1 Tax=Solanum dulcamara TaxID=45834 RepID=UPI0024858202|nr:uncharacterized protein LOC129900900 isoform X1 [Solanum dulcamara]
MGACASRPKDLDRDLAPAPVPAEESVTPEGDVVPQEKQDGEETKKEEPLIDVSTEAPKIEEVSTETNAVVEAEEETAKAAEEVKVEVVKEEPKEEQTAEEEKEAETVAQ